MKIASRRFSEKITASVNVADKNIGKPCRKIMTREVIRIAKPGERSPAITMTAADIS